MQTISEIARANNTTREPAADRRIPGAFTLCRDLRLPRGGILGQVQAVLAGYRRLTGCGLDPMEAVRVLDLIRADRDGFDPHDPRPIPIELAAVAAFMEGEGYDRDAVYLTIREIERSGTAGLSVSLDGEDRAAVEALIPPCVGSRERFVAWA